MVGLSPDQRFPHPMTWSFLADLLGLTSVHISRTIKRLREDGLVHVDRQTVRLLDVERLADLCEYEWITSGDQSAP